MDPEMTLAEALTSDLVLCDFCHNAYEHPLLLPCLHTFCQRCIVAMTTREVPESPRTLMTKTQRRDIKRTGQTVEKRNTQLQCPTCKVTVTLAGRPTDAEDNRDLDEYAVGVTPTAGITQVKPTTTAAKTTRQKQTTMSEEEEDSRDGDPGRRIRQSKSPIPESPDNNHESIAGESDADNGLNTDAGSSQKSPLKSEASSKSVQSEDAKEKEDVSSSNQTTAKQIKTIKAIVSNSLPVNRFLDSMSRLYHHRKDEGRLCAYCKTEGTNVEASTLCLQCQDYMCDTCVNAHKKTRITREHQMASFDAISRGLFDHDIRNATGFTPCPDHPHVQVSHFCSDCLIVACKSCRSKHHYGHNLQPLPEAVGKFMPEIKQIREALDRSRHSLAEYTKFLSQQLVTLASAKERAVTRVNDQTEIIIQMINERKNATLKEAEDEYQREKSKIEVKIANGRISELSTTKSASFLNHLSNLGKAEEVMAMYGHIIIRHRQLMASVPKPMTTKLNLTFQSGPTTDTNVKILVGKLLATRISVDGQETSRKNVLLSSLMPATLSPPRLLATISGTSGPSPVYPSGLAVKDNMLAVVDRENQQIKIYDILGQRLLKEFGGEELKGSTKQTQRRFKKAFDTVFLPNGVLAVTDPEAACVSMYEWTGRFIADFKGEVKHPRGITMNNKGEIVVVDGHLRQLTIHDATTGKTLRTIQPYRESQTTRDCITQKDDHDNQDQLVQKQSKINSPSSPPVLVDPFYVYVTNDDNMVISDAASPNLKILDPTGKLLAETMDYGTGPEQNLHPSGVCVDKYGFILVADTNNNRIHLGLPDGEMEEIPLLSPTEGLSHPVSLCLTKEGHLVVGQSGGEIKLYKYVK